MSHWRAEEPSPPLAGKVSYGGRASPPPPAPSRLFRGQSPAPLPAEESGGAARDTAAVGRAAGETVTLGSGGRSRPAPAAVGGRGREGREGREGRAVRSSASRPAGATVGCARAAGRAEPPAGISGVPGPRPAGASARSSPVWGQGGFPPPGCRLATPLVGTGGEGGLGKGAVASSACAGPVWYCIPLGYVSQAPGS